MNDSQSQFSNYFPNPIEGYMVEHGRYYFTLTFQLAKILESRK